MRSVRSFRRDQTPSLWIGLNWLIYAHGLRRVVDARCRQYDTEYRSSLGVWDELDDGKLEPSDAALVRRFRLTPGLTVLHAASQRQASAQQGQSMS